MSNRKPIKFTITPCMTEGPVDQKAADSWLGMAHFADTGPARTTCAQCAFAEKDGDSNVTCRKTIPTEIRPFPKQTASCRHFKLKEQSHAHGKTTSR
jgi:hypothetical protein